MVPGGIVPEALMTVAAAACHFTLVVMLVR